MLRHSLFRSRRMQGSQSFALREPRQREESNMYTRFMLDSDFVGEDHISDPPPRALWVCVCDEMFVPILACKENATFLI